MIIFKGLFKYEVLDNGTVVFESMLESECLAFIERNEV